LEGRLLVLRDVTERRQAEALQDTLVKTMVHDLRNPLTVVSAALEMLAHESGSLPEQTTSLVEMARANTRRLIDLVSTILDYQRLRSGRMPLAYAALDLGDLVLEAIALQRPLAEAKEQRLETAADQRMPLVDADRELILRVLQNLIGNSMKFAPRGGTIRVECRPGQGQVEVAVSDDGPGIPDELRRRLFSEFVTGSGDGRGTGLGLAFCRLAVEAHGGQISAANRPGGGASFTFSLPALS
jgi:signal transduction histidine kinase